MKKILPVSVDCMRFCSYRADEKDNSFEEYIFYDRHDFVADDDFSGIAVEIEVWNERFGKGARRNLSLTLVDMSRRFVVATRNMKLTVHKDDDYFEIHDRIPFDMISVDDDRTYKVVLRDETASAVLCEDIIHVYSERLHGKASEWYTAESAGLYVHGSLDTYKALRTTADKEYQFRFNLRHNFGISTPMVLPELEVNLYGADGSFISNWLQEPICQNGGINDYYVYFPFLQIDKARGVCYAELSCMEYPIAGLLIDTDADTERKGLWHDGSLAPLERYSAENAAERFRSLVEEDERAMMDAAFKAMLDDFSNTEKPATEEESDAAEDEPEVAIEEGEKGGDRTDGLLPSLDHLTGLREVKEKLLVYERVVRFNKMRADKGLPVSKAPLHAMFMGSPGTGKTTVAKMMGLMLRRAGVLSKGHVVVRERATLLGQYYSSEAEKTLAAIEEAQGGILFIDEAYQLYQPNDARDPGKFVIETLMTALADESRRDWMLVLAGYPDEMHRMFEMNPGFKSRIPDSNIYNFEDFTESELMDIAENYLSRLQFILSDEAHMALIARLRADYDSRDRNFGNARHVINLIETEILPAMAVRVTDDGNGNTDGNVLTEILASDIPSAAVPKQPAARSRIGFVA